MQKTIRLLALLLGVQLLLALGVSFGDSKLAARPAKGPLLALGDRTVDRLTIAGPDGERVVLAKVGGRWQLPEAGDFPADSDKVDRFVTRLKELEAGTPVATSSTAQKRFKVTDEDFERRITLAAGEQSLATLYVGSSPGIHHVHVRRGDDEAIHAVRFASYEAPVKAEDWEDKNVLKFAKDDIAAIRLGDLDLQRQPAPADADQDAPAAPTWAWSQDKPLDQKAADQLAERIANLRIGSVLGREAKPEYGLDKPVLTVAVTRKDGETVEYRLGKLADGADHVLKVSNRPEYFRLPSYAADGLVKATTPDTLVAKTSGETAAEEQAAKQS